MNGCEYNREKGSPLVRVFFGFSLLVFSPAAADAENYSYPSLSGGTRSRARATLTTQTSDLSTPSHLVAEIELRPSWNDSDGHFFTWNYAELGYRWNANVSLSYQQQFMTELSQYDASKPQHSFLRTFDGFVRTKVDNIWKSSRWNLSFSYESRVYLPTDPDKAGNGMIFAARNYFKITQQITSGCSLTFMEVPILHVYSEDGSYSIAPDGSAPTLAANPIFENQIYLEFDYGSAHSPWIVSFPIMLSSTRYRDYDPSASNNDSWAQWVEIYPELDYALTKVIKIGVAYESGNLINFQTSSNPSVNPAVGSGMIQGVFRATF